MRGPLGSNLGGGISATVTPCPPWCGESWSREEGHTEALWDDRPWEHLPEQSPMLGDSSRMGGSCQLAHGCQATAWGWRQGWLDPERDRVQLRAWAVMGHAWEQAGHPLLWQSRGCGDASGICTLPHWEGGQAGQAAGRAEGWTC